MQTSASEFNIERALRVSPHGIVPEEDNGELVYIDVAETTCQVLYALVLVHDQSTAGHESEGLAK